MTIETTSTIEQTSLHNRAVAQLQRRNFTAIAGDDLKETLKVDSKDLNDFCDHWNRLKQDMYMADGGTYRYRRYGEFDLDLEMDRFTLLPHQAYVQPSYINGLNGDVERHFEPLELSFSNSDLLRQLLNVLAGVYNKTLGENIQWNVRLHPYRIIASDKMEGLPTPEGLHRDGVTFIASMMIKRQNVLGGVTDITDNDKYILASLQLTDPFDIMIADDAQTMHQVSGIVPENADIELAYRDVLVIAFTKK